MQPTWKRNLAIVGIIIGVYVGLKYILPVMIPFLIGWLLAVWIYPWVCKLERKLKIKKSVWAAIFMGALAVGMGFLLYKGVIVLVAQVKLWLMNFHQVEEYCVMLMERCCHSLEENLGISMADSRRFIQENVRKIQNNFWGSIGPDTLWQATSYMKSIIFLVSGIIVTVISGVLFVKDLSDIRKNLRTFRFYPKWRRVLIRLKDTGITYVKAQLIIMVVIGAICTGGMWFMNSDYYLLFGIGLGLLDALPLIGTGLILFPSAVIGLLNGNYVVAVGCLLIELITSVVREFMEPRLIGQKLGVYPVVIMGAVYVGFLLFGVLGFFLGPVALLLIYSVGKEWDIWD